MLQLIEVQCPHCGAKGQIMVPPIGAMIIGPCPQCKEMVVVFCGQVLALDKEIMQGGELIERREHLMAVLTDFLRDRVGKLLSDNAPAEDEDEEAADEPSEVKASEEASAREEPKQQTGNRPGPISEAELQRFMAVDLKLLDNDAYFRSVFESR